MAIHGSPLRYIIEYSTEVVSPSLSALSVAVHSLVGQIVSQRCTPFGSPTPTCSTRSCIGRAGVQAWRRSGQEWSVCRFTGFRGGLHSVGGIAHHGRHDVTVDFHGDRDGAMAEQLHCIARAWTP